LDDFDGADDAYLKAIDLNAYNDIGDAAKQARTTIAEKIFKERNPEGGSMPRPDAMMYCLDALNKFKNLPIDDVRKITIEIATLGMSGLDVNDPDQKYQIRSLEGHFSGLHLLSIEYVGFKMIDPSVDIGFDLTKEYAAAKKMHEAS